MIFIRNAKGGDVIVPARTGAEWPIDFRAGVDEDFWPSRPDEVYQYTPRYRTAEEGEVRPWRPSPLQLEKA